MWLEFAGALEKVYHEVPAWVVSVAVSLDGVMAPMKVGQRRASRARRQAEGEHLRAGPTPGGRMWHLDFCDTQGERLRTVCMGRMPEAERCRLKASIRTELHAVLEAHTELILVKLTYDAKDDWGFFDHELPAGVAHVVLKPRRDTYPSAPVWLRLPAGRRRRSP